MADPLTLTWKGMTFRVYNTMVDIDFPLGEEGLNLEAYELDEFIELLQEFQLRMGRS